MLPSPRLGRVSKHHGNGEGFWISLRFIDLANQPISPRLTWLFLVYCGDFKNMRSRANSPSTATVGSVVKALKRLVVFKGLPLSTVIGSPILPGAVSW